MPVRSVPDSLKERMGGEDAHRQGSCGQGGKVPISHPGPELEENLAGLPRAPDLPPGIALLTPAAKAQNCICHLPMASWVS